MIITTEDARILKEWVIFDDNFEHHLKEGAPEYVKELYKKILEEPKYF